VDPVAYRLRILQPPQKNPPPPNPTGDAIFDSARLAAVLKLAAEKSGWGTPPANGRGRGIACHYSFDTYVAHSVEVSVEKDHSVKVHRVVCAVDCGRPVDPDGIRAQAEGAIVYALTAALYGEITIAGGAVEQSNFDGYPMLRMNEMPAIEVHIVQSEEKPTGMGEPCVPPVAPAVAGAIFAATGKRIRRLPIRSEDLA
jgi:isoquinoline 1-oxidoreductase subunit beta